jgi:hypothetical protein
MLNSIVQGKITIIEATSLCRYNYGAINVRASSYPSFNVETMNDLAAAESATASGRPSIIAQRTTIIQTIMEMLYARAIDTLWRQSPPSSPVSLKHCRNRERHEQPRPPRSRAARACAGWVRFGGGFACAHGFAHRCRTRMRDSDSGKRHGITRCAKGCKRARTRYLEFLEMHSLSRAQYSHI